MRFRAAVFPRISFSSIYPPSVPSCYSFLIASVSSWCCWCIWSCSCVRHSCAQFPFCILIFRFSLPIVAHASLWGLCIFSCLVLILHVGKLTISSFSLSLTRIVRAFVRICNQSCGCRLARVRGSGVFLACMGKVSIIRCGRASYIDVDVGTLLATPFSCSCRCSCLRFPH